MGGLYYPNTSTFTAIGTKSGTTRTSITLESTYQAESGQTKPTKAFASSGFSKMNVELLYTTGAGETSNSIEVKIEESSDGTNFYRIPNDSTSGDTSTITAREFTYVGASAATAYPISIGIDIFYSNIRISVKETGVASNKGTIFADVQLLGR